MKTYLSLFILAVSLLVLGCSSDSSDTVQSPTNLIKPVLADTTLAVAENSLSGQSVGVVTIVDEGDSAITLFTLTGTGSSLFDINASGSITVAESDTLDYETVTSYTLSSTATNSAGVSDSVVVIIKINDVDDTVSSPDADSDGYTVAAGDCNDADSQIHPGATEICDGIDNNCDAQIDEDPQQCDDGFACTDDTCDGVNGCISVSNNTLCDDGNECTIETCDPTDTGCDLDSGCIQDFATAGIVCDDNDPATVDDTCDGAGVCSGNACTDSDSDGVCDNEDTDDGNANICLDSDNDTCDDCSNGSYDPSNDGLDTDSDGLCNAGDPDDDGDGVVDVDDCAPLDANTYPGAPEICDGLDNDCSGDVPSDEIDNDGDGFIECGDSSIEYGIKYGGDCDDSDASIYPGRTELCDNIDNNCDTIIDEGCPTPSCELIGVGDVIITEMMGNPNTLSDTSGEWFEIYNTTGTLIDLTGWIVKDEGSNSFAIPENILISAGTHVTLAISSAPGFTPDVVYTNFTLSNSGDEIILMCGDSLLIDQVSYAEASNGVSLALDPAYYNSMDNDIQVNWCEGTNSYNGDLGTPGSSNISCP